jgi:phage gpG-like protein
MTHDFIADLRILAGEMQKTIKTLPGQVGALVLENIDDNFRSQSFDGEKWPDRAAPPARGRTTKAGGRDKRFKQDAGDGRAILTMSGRLRRSFRMEASGLVITIHTDVPYAEVHNEGGTVNQTVSITPKMRKFFWAMFSETKDEKWKFMALTKNATLERHFVMPKRQFVGENPTLDRNINYLLESELSSIFA